MDNGGAILPQKRSVQTNYDKGDIQKYRQLNALKGKRPALQLDKGTRLPCKRRDGLFYDAEIIKLRKSSTGDVNYEYYVHYRDLDKRLDEWVGLDKLDTELVKIFSDEVENKAGNSMKTCDKKRKIDRSHEQEELMKVKNIETIDIGRHRVETWYYSPFPPPYNACNALVFCEFCFSFMENRDQLGRHMKECDSKHPPGNEIYRNGQLSMFEVDGKKNRIYAQNLCYLSKLFLDHKTLYHDVEIFLFYILCYCDDRGCHMVGYFSKEKHSEAGCNLACILTLPPYQRKGYGGFLIAFSYELSKMEGKVGTPEKPISDLGLMGYRGYWTRVLVEILKEHQGTVSIKKLTDMTKIKTEDAIGTLQSLKLIRYQYHKGDQDIRVNPELLEQVKISGKGLQVDTSKLIWTPYKEPDDY